ncbi:hypothetical protein B0J14DRAFT_642249 [Halenospora varia]|nr:hypothetical protein B0J14DRAFT_642249 [Halenospora varia]
MFGFGNLFVVWNLLFTERPSKHFDTTQDVVTDGRQLPVCSECVPREFIVAPGVGIDLTSTYGTVAIRYRNHTVVDLGKINGSIPYRQMMEEMVPPYKYYGPPFNNIEDQLKYEWEQLQRKIRRAKGLPSTWQIQVLQDMLLELYNLSLTHTSEPLIPGNFVLSIPYLPNLHTEDLNEAIHNANLTRLNSYKNYGPIHQVNSAYAGSGFGLCKHWGDIQKCEEEEQIMGGKDILTISYTKEELILETSYAYGAHQIWATANQRHPEYGFGKAKSKDFWNDIKLRITTMIKASGRHISELLLIGESAEEKEFLDTVWKALDEVGQKELYNSLQVPGFNAEFVAARGSAEFAKRWQGEAPGCLEGDWCEGNRKPGDDAVDEL